MADLPEIEIEILPDVAGALEAINEIREFRKPDFTKITEFFNEAMEEMREQALSRFPDLSEVQRITAKHCQEE